MRRLFLLCALGASAVLSTSCALIFPPSVTVSVYQSVLGNYSSRPIWEWRVGGFGIPTAIEVSLDGGAYIEVANSSRSYRPQTHLAPGSYTLTVRISTATLIGAVAQDAATATVTALPGGAVTPNDSCYPAGGVLVDRPTCTGVADSGSGQWGLPLSEMPRVWQAFANDVLPAPGAVRVAVIDTGYLAGPDLVNNLETGAGTQYDFILSTAISGDGDGIDPNATDEGDDGGAGGSSWHGTSVAGVIAADTDDATGIAGMGWPWDGAGGSQITVIPIRALGIGGGTLYDIAQSVLYAAGLENDSGTVLDPPAKIINLSLGSAGATVAVLDDALRQATEAGSIPVAATGNFATAVYSPANSNYAIAVGAIDIDESLASYSNFGPQTDIVGPGGDSDYIWAPNADAATGIPRETIGQTGTSFAAPHVAAALALVAAIDDSITFADAKAMLAESAVDLGPEGFDELFGHGRLDVYALFGSYPPRPGASQEPLGRIDSDDVYRPGSAVPATADATSLIVRWRDDAQPRPARTASAAGLAARHGVASVSAGAQRHALVRLAPGQTREALKARLEADPDVAAVYYNQIFLPQ